MKGHQPFRKGTLVRLKGWQAHWQKQNAKIASINTARTEAILDSPILGRRAWRIADLSKVTPQHPEKQGQ
jgi:hypothetical protein